MEQKPDALSLGREQRMTNPFLTQQANIGSSSREARRQSHPYLMDNKDEILNHTLNERSSNPFLPENSNGLPQRDRRSSNPFVHQNTTSPSQIPRRLSNPFVHQSTNALEQVDRRLSNPFLRQNTNSLDQSDRRLSNPFLQNREDKLSQSDKRSSNPFLHVNKKSSSQHNKRSSNPFSASSDESSGSGNEHGTVCDESSEVYVSAYESSSDVYVSSEEQSNPFLSRQKQPLPQNRSELTEDVEDSDAITPIPVMPAPAQLSRSGSKLQHYYKYSDASTLCATEGHSVQGVGLESVHHPTIRSPVFPGHSQFPVGQDYKENSHAVQSAWDSNTSVTDSVGSPSGGEDDPWRVNMDWGSSDALPITSRQPSRSRRSGRAVGSFISAMKAAFLRHVEPKVIIEMVDFRHVFWPFGIWKYTVLALVAAAIAGIVVSEHYTGWLEKSMDITRQNILAVLIVVLGLEPAMISIVLLVARVENLDPSDRTRIILDTADVEANFEHSQKIAKLTGKSGRTNSISEKVVEATIEVADESIQATEKSVVKAIEIVEDHSTALVIPCHNSDRTAMRKVLESAYPHFRPQDIFIVDNGRTKYPPDDFRGWIRQQHPDIVYIWSPIGSKNAAQLVGALAAKNYGYIMTVDDDVSIPDNFRAPTDKINDVTKGVAFPLRAIDAEGKCPLFMVAWQDCEYKMSGLSKMAESRVCGVLYPHGAGWFCERETLVDLISNYHSLDFIAEDVNTGLSMQKMKKRIAMDSRIVLETEVPTTIIGPGLNWWQQRKNSWEMGRHGRLLAFMGRLFFSLNGQNTIHGIVAQKFVHCYAIATLVVDWVRIPVLVTMGGNSVFWRQALLLMLVSIIPLIIFKYINARRRPDLQPTFWGCMTYPMYKWLYAAVSVVGAIRSVIWYIGGHKRAESVQKMIKNKDERVFWLDPRFDTNPGYLADEGEALQAGQHDPNLERFPEMESTVPVAVQTAV